MNTLCEMYIFYILFFALNSLDLKQSVYNGEINFFPYPLS